MKIRKNRNKLLCGDFKNDMPFATIDENTLTRKALENFILKNNSGNDMIELYEQWRCNLNLTNIADFLLKLEEIFLKYDVERYSIIKKKANYE